MSLKPALDKNRSLKGSMIDEAAFAHSKMTNSVGWSLVLRDEIVPSDIDLCFDNDIKHRMLVCELSRDVSEWRLETTGQRRLQAFGVELKKKVGHG